MAEPAQNKPAPTPTPAQSQSPAPKQQTQNKPAPKQVPEQIQGAFQAWMFTALLQALGFIVAAAINIIDPASLTANINMDTLREQTSAAGADFSDSQLLMVLRGVVVVGAFLGIVLAALFVAVNYQMRKGKSWARFVLVIGSGYLVVQAVFVFVNTGVPAPVVPAWLEFFSAATAIGSAAAAASGAILASSSAALTYFGFDKKPPQQAKH